MEWVALPNTLGMGQFADGGPAAGLPDGVGQMASKPYVATGKYIQRMSNHCAGCRFKPVQSSGDDACPFTTLYWDFLGRHQASLARNPRMALQVKNLARLSDEQRAAISARADAVRAGALDSASDGAPDRVIGSATCSATGSAISSAIGSAIGSTSPGR